MNLQDDRNTVLAAKSGELQARLMLVLLCLIWGTTWPLMRIALDDLPPLTMRASSGGIGALTLLAICFIKRRSLRIPTAKAWVHVVVSSILNIVCFTVLSAVAQTAAATSRVAVLTYTMPIWALVLAWFVLRERPTVVQVSAVVLCVTGLAVLIHPLASAGIPLGLLLAVGAGFSWAAGTVYMKWSRVEGDPLGIASWQITIAFVITLACTLIFEHGVHLGGAHLKTVLAVAFTGMAGNAIAYIMWFGIVRRLPAVTAALGVLGIPVIGVVGSVLIIGERPTTADLIGFALILAASACAQIPTGVPDRITG